MHSRKPLGWPLRKHITHLSPVYRNNFYFFLLFFKCNFAASPFWLWGAPLSAPGERRGTHMVHRSVWLCTDILYNHSNRRKRQWYLSLWRHTLLFHPSDIRVLHSSYYLILEISFWGTGLYIQFLLA